jgi:hypothetical protein
MGPLLRVGTKVNLVILLLHKSSPAQSTMLKFNNRVRPRKWTLGKETPGRKKVNECELIAYRGAK